MCDRAVLTGEWVDMIQAGIVGPVKVTRSALRNAASAAAMFFTTEAVVGEKPEKEKAPAGGGMEYDVMKFGKRPLLCNL